MPTRKACLRLPKSTKVLTIRMLDHGRFLGFGLFAPTRPHGPVQVWGMALSTAHGGLEGAIGAYNYKFIVNDNRSLR